MSLLNSLTFAQHLLRQHLKTGDMVLDGTAGNGNDTLFLAQCVGNTGHVYAFDIQEVALFHTAERLQQHSMRERVKLIHAGHERVAEFVPHSLAAAMFNFGYLPHGDVNITTLPETSIAAVDATLQLLQSHGILAAVLYHGHAQGKIETPALLDYASQLSASQYRVLRYELVNQNNCPPIALMIEKLA